MPKTKLTLQQEAFCNYIAAGANQKDAAVKAGYKENSAKVTASRLMNKDHIKERVDEIREEVTEEVKYSSTEIIKDLIEIKDSSMFQMNWKSAIKAIAEINKMEGNYAPVKSEGKMEITEKPDLSNLSDQELEQLNKTLSKVN